MMANNSPPALAWPSNLDEDSRDNWYHAVILEYLALWDDDVTEAMFTPATAKQIEAVEKKIGCPLPAALKNYHLKFGVVELGEQLCKLKDPQYDVFIQPLLDAFPGIDDMDFSEADMNLAEQLIVFGDYLGNGNMWCFHAESQKIYYFDHDSEPQLTLFFDEMHEYLDALMIRSLGEIHDDDATAEALLTEKIGKNLVKKWLY
jgi:SMI1-KNR4 cell-wall